MSDNATISRPRAPQPMQQSTSSPPSGTDTFELALQFTLRAEGGISYDKRDPANKNGNITAYGVTQQSYDTYRATLHLPERSVAHITSDEIRSLYQSDYYQRVRGAELPPALAIVLFDTAVNIGPGRTIRMLQSSLQQEADGVFGPKTMAALRKRYPTEVVESVLQLRSSYYKTLSTQERFQPFLRGWLNRVESLRSFIINIQVNKEKAHQAPKQLPPQRPLLETHAPGVLRAHPLNSPLSSLRGSGPLFADRRATGIS